MLAEMEKQKKLVIEQTRTERERARKEREELIARIKTTSSSSKKVIKKEIKTERAAQPQIQVPPVHPFYGPAVYDYNANNWTYPYAQWYGMGGEAPTPPPAEPKEPVVEIIEKVEPPPETVDIGIGCNKLIIPERPIQINVGIQMDDIPKPKEEHKATGPDLPCTDDRGTQHDLEVKPKTLTPRDYVDVDVIKQNAASKIAVFYKRKVLARRERAYYMGGQGVLFSRKRRFNKKMNAIEVMSMFVIASPNEMALCLRFEIFNLALKQIVYQGLCDSVHHLSEFNVHELLRLA